MTTLDTRKPVDARQLLNGAEDEAARMRAILDETWDTDDAQRPARAPFHMPKKMTDKLPSAFKRTRSAYGFLSAWRRLREAVWVARGVPYNRLPDFAGRWGKRLYETHERAAYDALCDGDVMFFEAWSARLLFIDQAAEAAGLTIADRGTLLYAHGVLKGYADAAARQLKTLGGKWPPR
jgi:hypothetical protein